MAKTMGGEDDTSQKGETNKPSETIPNPPSFFDEDMTKWKNKFAKSIREREIFKKDFAKTQELTCLTRNTNIRSSDAEA